MRLIWSSVLIMRIRTILVYMVMATASIASLAWDSSIGFAQEPPSEERPGTVAPGTLGGAPAGPSETPPPTQKPIRIPLTEVIGTGPAALEHIPGSGRVVTKESLEKNRRFTINEALREVPGVNVRDEEGLGIRPNIGIRGLDPTRSRNIHIMEDGVPIMIMPYGDPSAYYFPPVFRFDRIEVLKGSGQLLYGPTNIGGVMNLITRMPPATPGGNLQFWAGNNNYFNTHLDYGGTWGKSGYLLDMTHYQSDTPRFTNVRAKVDDVTFKTVQELSDRTSILAKFNYYREDSGIGYQGLTEAMYATRPRFTPFEHDNFDFRRLGYHVAVQHMFTANLTSTTNFFGHYIQRDWTRQFQQGLTAAGTPDGSAQASNAIPATSVTVAPANQRFTNAREYWVYGVEPRFHLTYRLLGLDSEADFGARYMYEESNRQQFRNTGSGVGVSQSCFGDVDAGPGITCLGENNLRTTNAYALFFQNRFFLTDRITVTPGFRVEHVNYDQNNRLANDGNGNFGKTSMTEALPGIGATYSPVKGYTFFGGVHRGFAPPQISDAVTATGQVVDLDAQLNWTYELGMRSNPLQWLGYELTFFQMDFQNQIIPQSVAGGVGSTLTNAGRTKHRGIEFATKADVLDMVTGYDRDHDITVDFNYTWIAQAEFRGTRNSALGASALLPGETPSSAFNVSGNRLPYAPKHMLTAGVGYSNGLVGFDARAEVQCISDMFGDDRNTFNPTPNGQRGIIQGWCLVNAAANQYVKPINTTFFVTGKNLFDQTFIVDRTRGIYAGLPLLVQAGARWSF
jgi:Fe(3+) dicitrate transport protein